MPYYTRHACEFFNITPQTVRAWAEEFQEYLSESAKSESGRHRQFTDEDMQVLSLVYLMRRDGSTFDDIHASLASGQRAELPSAVRPEEQVSDLALKVKQLETDMALLREHEMRLSILMEAKDQRIVELTAELKAARDEIRKLDREIGKLESRIDDGD